MDLTHNLPFPVLSIYNYTNSFIVHVVKMKKPTYKATKMQLHEVAGHKYIKSLQLDLIGIWFKESSL